MKSLSLPAIICVCALSAPGYAYDGEPAQRAELFQIEYAGSQEDIPVIDVIPANTLKDAELPEWLIPLSTDDQHLKPFTGVWRGQWEGTLDSYFVLTEQKNGRVKAFYSWGSNAITREPGMRYVWGVILGDVILLPGNDTSVSLTMREDGNLFGLFYSRRVHMPSRIIMTRSP
ncbi:hypothetical protein V1T76_28950 [Roseibium sp. FZY0029]|uniref:hypothetical protein n=1 Tax=Roseibium sp. FZY0029 TaxID=3116647 RepID=UPI002E9B3807|nr:hypothetical protein [Roseibium sp. FZY0029]